jgi:hypothetical protein
MTADAPEEGYLLTNGRMVAIDDVGTMCAELTAGEPDLEKLERVLWGLTRECLDYYRFDGAIGYLAKIVTLTRDDQTKALCFLETGRALEKKPDYPGAADAYLRAFTLPALQNDTWYSWRANAGGLPRYVNSAYRAPKHNQEVGGVWNSRHMHGDAVDLRNVPQTSAEYTLLKQAALNAGADYVEPWTGPCSNKCVHADWGEH